MAADGFFGAFAFCHCLAGQPVCLRQRQGTGLPHPPGFGAGTGRRRIAAQPPPDAAGRGRAHAAGAGPCQKLAGARSKGSAAIRGAGRDPAGHCHGNAVDAAGDAQRRCHHPRLGAGACAAHAARTAGAERLRLWRIPDLERRQALHRQPRRSLWRHFPGQLCQHNLAGQRRAGRHPDAPPRALDHLPPRGPGGEAAGRNPRLAPLLCRQACDHAGPSERSRQAIDGAASCCRPDGSWGLRASRSHHGHGFRAGPRR